MGYNHLLLPAFMLISYLLIPYAFPGQHSNILYNCSVSNESYATGSNYSQSLGYLVDDLWANAPDYEGFRNASWAEDPTNRAYGLALCRYNVSKDDCKACLINATIMVVNNYCPNHRGAIIWLDHCQLKYSDVDFLGKIDEYNYAYMMNETKADDLDFNYEALTFLRGLSDNIDATMYFASGIHRLRHNKTLYGLVQCTRDLSISDCKDCLQDAAVNLALFCGYKVGARFVYGSCFVRYETYPFLRY